MKINLVKEKETKHTWRYSEVPAPGQPAIIGTLYVQKFAAEQLGNEIVVTIEKFQ